MQSNIAVLSIRTSDDIERFMQVLHERRAELAGEEMPGQHLDEAGLMALKERLASESKAIAVK